ncbi:MAG: enoyl-CoA hydratase [Cryomorphaceae bacterium]|jgi:enoyl-CoA hydratase
MEFKSSVIDVEVNDHIATVWLNRPEKLNAVDMPMWQDLPAAMQAAVADVTVRAVVVAGRGKSFCVGIDLSTMGGMGVDLSTAEGCIKQQVTTKICQQAITSVADCPVPVIAAIHSHCLGAGVDLATACDIRLASDDATFGVRETKIGIVADVGTLQRLPSIVGAGHVAELAYTGKDISAERAREIGLVNHTYADQEAVLSAAYSMAQGIADNAPLAVRGTKLMLQKGKDLTTDQSLLLNGLLTMATTLNSNDLNEAMQAFMQKRPASFTGT